MRRVLSLFIVVGAVLAAVGCQQPVDNPGTADQTGKPQVGEAKGEKRLNEDFSVTPAPEGVKTGTPGPGGK